MNCIACHKEMETEDDLNQGQLCDNCYEDGITHDVYLELGLNHDSKNNSRQCYCRDG